jgi:hypothetical protein
MLQIMLKIFMMPFSLVDVNIIGAGAESRLSVCDIQVSMCDKILGVKSYLYATSRYLYATGGLKDLDKRRSAAVPHTYNFKKIQKPNRCK